MHNPHGETTQIRLCKVYKHIPTIHSNGRFGPNAQERERVDTSTEIYVDDMGDALWPEQLVTAHSTIS